MGFLKKLLAYNKICIQCHNNPDSDALASAYCVSRYLEKNNVRADIVYGGKDIIKKSDAKMLIKECGINISHTDAVEGYDLLLLIDCQKGNGNVFDFNAEKTAIIDHHIRVVGEDDLYLIKNYQSCSTIVWELLCEENFEIDYSMSVALLYGLYTDTSSYKDLYSQNDSDMRKALYSNQPLFERLTKSSMTDAEVLIAGDALLHHYLDIERKFAIVEALKCDQTVLGYIGDIVICIDVVALSIAYCMTTGGYQISLRSSDETVKASDAAKFICDGIGSGGGHPSKAGGYISEAKMKEKYGDMKIFDVINMLLSEFFDGKSGDGAKE